MTNRERTVKLQKLQDLIIDEAIKKLEEGDVSMKDMSSIITFLKNNQVVEEKPRGQSEADLMEELLDEIGSE